MSQIDTQMADGSPDEWNTRIVQACQSLTRKQAVVVEMFPPAESASRQQPAVVLPGSFNPLHAGHCRMAAVARELTGQPVHFELSICNADKPQADAGQIVGRILRSMPGQKVNAPLAGEAGQEQFSPHGLILSNLPRFIDKARCFRGATFVTGIDTWMRIANPAFYQGQTMPRAIDKIAAQNCRFLVMGRLVDGKYVGMEDLVSRGKWPAALVDISTHVPQSMFRFDLSSSTLRKRSGPQADTKH